MFRLRSRPAVHLERSGYPFKRVSLNPSLGVKTIKTFFPKENFFLFQENFPSAATPASDKQQNKTRPHKQHSRPSFNKYYAPQQLTGTGSISQQQSAELPGLSPSPLPQFYPQFYPWRSPSPSTLAGRGCPLPALRQPGQRHQPPLRQALSSHTGPYPRGLHYKASLQHTSTNEVKKQASPNSLLCDLSALSRCWSLICIYFWPKQQYRIIIFKWPDSHSGGWRPLLISSPCLVSLSSS